MTDEKVIVKLLDQQLGLERKLTSLEELNVALIGVAEKIMQYADSQNGLVAQLNEKMDAVHQTCVEIAKRDGIFQ